MLLKKTIINWKEEEETFSGVDLQRHSGDDMLLQTAPRRGATDAESRDRSMEVRRTWVFGLIPDKGRGRDEERDRLRVGREAAATAAVEKGRGRASLFPCRPDQWLSALIYTGKC